jgi:hypothetical protein
MNYWKLMSNLLLTKTKISYNECFMNIKLAQHEVEKHAILKLLLDIAREQYLFRY